MKAIPRFLSRAILLVALIPCPLWAQPGTSFPISTPEAQGVSSEAIHLFVEKAEAEIDALHSFMILRHGKLIARGWWDPYGPDIPHVIHSLSKSFTSTAIGFAVDEELLSLNDLVFSYFPEEAPEEPGWQLKELRIRDLLTMNTGHIQEPRIVWSGENNWVQVFFDADLELMPGTHFKYNSAATYMLSAILQKVTGEKLVDFLEPRLFRPLEIKKPAWDSCPRGINTGGWGLHIVTEDIAKLGQLYLQKGVWEGKRILSEAWVELATSRQVSNGSNPGNDWTQGYGFQFWRCRHNCYRGDGAFGQFCIVMPDQDAVVAITSGASDMARIMELVWEILLPAMTEEPLMANKPALEELELKTTGLALNPVKGEKSTPGSRKVSKKRFTISENSAGVQAVSFDLRKDEHQISLEMDQGSETIHIGSGVYKKSVVSYQLPYTNSRYQKIAASGAWVKQDVYRVRIYQYETPARITYTFTFNDAGLVWDSKLEHSLFGPRTEETLSGKP